MPVRTGAEVERSLARFLHTLKAEGRSPKTILYYKDAVSSLLRYMEGAGLSTDIRDLDATAVRSWIISQRDRGLADKTLATRTQGVKIFVRWCVAEDLLDRDPLARLKLPKVKDTAKPTFVPEEVDRLLEACDVRTVVGVRDRALILTLYSTAARITEVRVMKLSDIDWTRGTVLLHGKGGKDRAVPIAGKAAKALDLYTRHPQRRDKVQDTVFLTFLGQPMTQDGFRQIFRRLAARTGLHVNPHKFRHSAAIQYLRNGGKLETLKALLGHQSMEMTLHYARIAGVDVTQAHMTADPARSLKSR